MILAWQFLAQTQSWHLSISLTQAEAKCWKEAHPKGDKTNNFAFTVAVHTAVYER